MVPDALPTLRTPTAAEPLRVLLVGDSYMYDAQPGIVAALEATGVVEIIEGAQLGFALANEGWELTLQELVDEHQPDLVATMWARFDVAWLESHDDEEYVERLDQAIEILSSNGATVGIFGLAPSLTGGVDQEPVDRSINQIFASTPERFPGTAFYVDPDPIVAPDGQPNRWLTTPEGTLLVRKVDVSHFCSDGAARYGLAFTELLQRLDDGDTARPGHLVVRAVALRSPLQRSARSVLLSGRGLTAFAPAMPCGDDRVRRQHDSRRLGSDPEP